MLQTRSSILLVAQVNTQAGGSAVVITNSSNLFITNTSLTVLVQNSAGWIINQANTGGAVAISNSAGWIFAQSNTSPLVQVQNSAGWIVNVANTGGATAITNTAGWAVYSLDSAATGAVVSVIASTVGTVVLAAAQVKRVALSIYNASVNPLFMKMGSGAKTTDFTLMMVGSGYYEIPRPIYNGEITGVWGTADGSAYITETT